MLPAVAAPPGAVPPVPFASPSSAPPAGAFALSPAKDDTALFQDARIGFSHLVPGRPTLGLVSLRPGELPADAVLHLQDAPISIRYHLTPPQVAASTAFEVAIATASRTASYRARSHVPVELANDTWLAAWGVEAAAVASYDVAPPPGAPPTHEDLFVLVRQGLVLTVAWTYLSGFVDDPAYATFASVAEATMVWDPARWEHCGRIWPESPFAGPGLHTVPKPQINEAARLVARAPIAPDERLQVLGILTGVVSGAGAPWVVLTPEIVEGNRRAILAAARTPELRTFVERAFAGVRTAHDLRSLAIVLGRALGEGARG